VQSGETIKRLAPPNRLAELKKVQGLSYTQVAAALGVTEITVRRWENRSSGIPDRHKVELAALFGVSVPWLMHWEDGNHNGNGDAA
jgi:DNA-binding transcriptional regulator YiaG